MNETLRKRSETDLAYRRALDELCKAHKTYKKAEKALRKFARNSEVADETWSMTLEEAKAAEEAEQLDALRWQTSLALFDTMKFLNDHEPRHAKEVVPYFDPAVGAHRGDPPITKRALRQAAAYLTALAELWVDP